jgi:hypothetical protein
MLIQCFDCQASVEYDASVSFRTGSTTKIICPKCTKRELERSPGWWPLHGPCKICGITVYRSRAQAHYLSLFGGAAGGLTCSADCNRQWHLDEAKAKRHAARQPKPCAICKKEFMPRRSDAVTCSNACRQALFRAKQKPHLAVEPVCATD